LAVNGFAADGNMFVKKVKQRLEVCMHLPHQHTTDQAHVQPQWYRHAHAKDMPLRAIARLIQTMLYARRFFPYYVYNILGGIEEDGMYTSYQKSASLSSVNPNRIRRRVFLRPCRVI
jgi:20S proteasome subunit beta 6